MNSEKCLIEALRNADDYEARAVIDESLIGFTLYCRHGDGVCEHMRSTADNAQDKPCAKGHVLYGQVVIDTESVRPYDRELLRVED